MSWLMFFGLEEHFDNYTVKATNFWHDIVVYAAKIILLF